MESEPDEAAVLYDEIWLGEITWLAFVIVSAPTGVYWEHQCGGNTNRLKYPEGYAFPVRIDEARPVFDRVFLEELRGGGVYRDEFSESQLQAIREAVGTIVYHHRHNPNVDSGAFTEGLLSIDESRLDELNEAWIPVITGDGPGTLVWENSD